MPHYYTISCPPNTSWQLINTLNQILDWASQGKFTRIDLEEYTLERLAGAASKARVQMVQMIRWHHGNTWTTFFHLLVHNLLQCANTHFLSQSDLSCCFGPWRYLVADLPTRRGILDSEGNTVLHIMARNYNAMLYYRKVVGNQALFSIEILRTNSAGKTPKQIFEETYDPIARQALPDDIFGGQAPRYQTSSQHCSTNDLQLRTRSNLPEAKFSLPPAHSESSQYHQSINFFGQKSQQFFLNERSALNASEMESATDEGPALNWSEMESATEGDLFYGLLKTTLSDEYKSLFELGRSLR